MNENFERLLPNPFAVDYIGTDQPIDLYTEKEMVKFAESIIKECIKLCLEINDINQHYIKTEYIDPELGPKECIEVIKNHFEVE